MQPRLSHCEREKTPIRRTRRDGWRWGRRLLFNEALKKPEVKSRWPLTYFRPSTDSFSSVVFDDMKFLVEMTVAVCSPHLPSLHVKYQSKEEGRSAHSGRRASNNVVFNKTDFCSTAEQLEYSLASWPLRRRMIGPHSYHLLPTYSFDRSCETAVGLKEFNPECTTPPPKKKNQWVKSN